MSGGGAARGSPTANSQRSRQEKRERLHQWQRKILVNVLVTVVAFVLGFGIGHFYLGPMRFKEQVSAVPGDLEVGECRFEGDSPVCVYSSPLTLVFRRAGDQRFSLTRTGGQCKDAVPHIVTKPPLYLSILDHGDFHRCNTTTSGLTLDRAIGQIWDTTVGVDVKLYGRRQRELVGRRKLLGRAVIAYGVESAGGHALACCIISHPKG